jgi:hypothetical protein
MIHILGTDFVHFYLLEEDGEITLVDAGVSGYRKTLEPALARIGRSIDDVKAIVLTHADPDHVGFAGELQRTHAIPVYVHRADSDRTREGRTKKTEASPLDMLTMLRHADARRALRHMIANGGARQPKVAEVIPFDDGDQLDVPGRLQAIHTPGHSDGHCVLYAPSRDAVHRRRCQQHQHLHRTARRPGRAHGREHLHRPSLRVPRDDRRARRRHRVLRPRRPVHGRAPRHRRRGPRPAVTGLTPGYAPLSERARPDLTGGNAIPTSASRIGRR